MRRRLILASATLGLCLGVVGIVAHYYPPGSVYALGLTTASGYLGLAALAAAVLFALVRTRAGWTGCAASAALVVWFAALHLPAYVAEAAPAHGSDVTVMTSNLKVGSADAAAVVAAVRSHRVDVLMLEELTPQIVGRLRAAGLSKALPYSVADPREFAAGTGIWSRYPLTDTRVRRDLGFSFVTARVSGRPLTVAALHVYGPYPQAQFPFWHHDMQRYPAVLAGLPGRTVLIGGDFNATTDDAQFRAILGSRYSDAAGQAGAGFTPTWPADRWYPPLITIDHVLTRGAVAQSADSVEIPGSDHRALVVAVRVPPDG